MKVVYPITLDVKKTNVQKIIKANQGEGADRELVITLVSGNETIHLSNENDVVIKGKKADDTVFVNGPLVVKNGKIYYWLTTQNLSVIGDVDCQVEVVSDGVTYSAKFVIDVEEPIVSDDEIESSNEYSELIHLIKTAGKGKIYTGTSVPETTSTNYPLIKTDDIYIRYDENDNRLLGVYQVTVTSEMLLWEQIVVTRATNRVFMANLDPNYNGAYNNPTTFNIKLHDVFINNVEQKIYVATTVTTSTVTWSNIVDLNNKQDKLTVEGHSVLNGGHLSNRASRIWGVGLGEDPDTDPDRFDTTPQQGDLWINESGAQTYGTNIRLWLCDGIEDNEVSWQEVLFHDARLHNGTTNPPTNMRISHAPYDKGDFYLKKTSANNVDAYELFYLADISYTGYASDTVYTLVWIELTDYYSKNEIDTLLSTKVTRIISDTQPNPNDYNVGSIWIRPNRYTTDTIYILEQGYADKYWEALAHYSDVDNKADRKYTILSIECEETGIEDYGYDVADYSKMVLRRKSEGDYTITIYPYINGVRQPAKRFSYQMDIKDYDEIGVQIDGTFEGDYAELQFRLEDEPVTEMELGNKLAKKSEVVIANLLPSDNSAKVGAIYLAPKTNIEENVASNSYSGIDDTTWEIIEDGWTFYANHQSTIKWAQDVKKLDHITIVNESNVQPLDWYDVQLSHYIGVGHNYSADDEFKVVVAGRLDIDVAGKSIKFNDLDETVVQNHIYDKDFVKSLRYKINDNDQDGDLIRFNVSMGYANGGSRLDIYSLYIYDKDDNLIYPNPTSTSRKSIYDKYIVVKEGNNTRYELL